MQEELFFFAFVYASRGGGQGAAIVIGTTTAIGAANVIRYSSSSLRSMGESDRVISRPSPK